MRFALGLLVFIVSAVAHSKTLLISDIDDTIKISHVLSTRESAMNAFRTKNLFGGMNGLYRALQQTDSSIRFYYVSNAPRQLMQNSHSQFLAENQFPSGILSLRPNIFGGNFKLAELRRIITLEKPTKVILVGDNGELDPVIYEQITKEFFNIEFQTYIHLAYSVRSIKDRGAALEGNQTGYVTSWDLLLHWREQGLISDKTAVKFMKAFAQAYLYEREDLRLGTVVIPVWMDCEDFIWSARDWDLTFAEHLMVKQKIQNRCQRTVPAEALEPN